MSGAAAAALAFTAMLVLIALRMPVGLSMLLTGAVGYIHLSSWPAFFAYMKANPYHQFANYTLSVIPLFILMGALAERSGLSSDLFRAAGIVLGRLRGGFAMGLIGACAVFGAICGSSVATTATFARSTLPEFRRVGYEPGFVTGAIAAGGTLGILIPPSIILVVYAITTEQNIAKLFMAALLPGILAAIFYCIVIALVVRAKPGVAPAVEPSTPETRRSAMWGVWPTLLIAVIVVGGIYGGIFTPTEAAAVGAIAMLLQGLVQRRIGWPELRDAILQTAETSGMIFIILLGAEVFESFLALSRLPADAAQLVAGIGLSPYAVIVVLMAVYILLGAVMDELAMILLTLPVFFPIVQGLDFGLSPDEVAIWFGILVLIVAGIGLTAPPIGLNVFVVAAIAKDVPIARTYRGVLPFIAADIIRLALVVAFPGLALWLVGLLS